MDNVSSLITPAFSQQICDILSEESNHQVILANHKGIILAATDKSRIGSVHSIAKRVMNGEFDEYSVTTEEANTMNGVRAGVNIPVIYRGVRVANIGISGDPIEARSLTRIGVRMVHLWLQNQEFLTNVRQTAKVIQDNVQDISAAVEQMSAGAEEIAAMGQVTHQTAMESTTKVADVENILDAIKHIASQSKLIGLNASIESARLGEGGRAFSVIAEEIRRLAANSEESTVIIGQTLNQIREIFGVLAKKVGESQIVADEQSSALISVVERIVEIENSMNSLVELLAASSVAK